MRADSAAAFEPVARRIRARAEMLLANLPTEDPDVVWARRAALLAEVDGAEPASAPRGRSLIGNVWRWSADAIREVRPGPLWAPCPRCGGAGTVPVHSEEHPQPEGSGPPAPGKSLRTPHSGSRNEAES
jgi:hypothetical protein